MSHDERQMVEADKLLGWRTIAVAYERLVADGQDVALNQMLFDAVVIAIRDYQRTIWQAECEADPSSGIDFEARFPTWRDR